MVRALVGGPARTRFAMASLAFGLWVSPVANASARLLPSLCAACDASGGPSTMLPSSPSPSPATTPTQADPTPQASVASCPAWTIDYALAANLRLTDTPLGRGNGVYHVGPGSLTLRFDNQDGGPAGKVKLISYEVREPLVIVATVAFWTTKVTSLTTTRKEPDGCGAPPEGRLEGTVVQWERAIPAFRSDGTVSCEGAFCGHYGAPPLGSMPFHIEPHAVKLSPLQFSRDLRTFTMPWTFVAKTELPKQTAYVTLSGREVRRTCAPPSSCR